MREKKKSGLFCYGQNSKKLHLFNGVIKVVSGLSLLGGAALFSGVAYSAICFLPDCGDKILEFQGDANVSTKYCRDMGYTYYELGQCPPYYHQEVCPDNSHYLKCDAQKWCEDNGYNTLPEECVAPQYADEQCLNGLNYYKQCKEDLARACSEENPDYVSECQEGWKLDDDELCSYSPLYGKCCNECEDYPYEEDEIPQGYQKGESCLACGDITKYKAKLKDCAGDGFIQCANGGKTGTEVCWRGDEKWYKECCAPCDDYPYLENQIPEGYVKGDSCDSCDGMKYKTKIGECAEGYEWKYGVCVSSCPTSSCAVGDILYSDKTCSSGCTISGKTPIGVVSYVNGSTRLAINLVHTSIQWGGYGTDISELTNFTNFMAQNDFSGKSNTAKIVVALGDHSNYAAGYCYNYTTDGTSKGDWHLPAEGELYASIRTNNKAVNSGLSAAGGTQLFVDSYYWSSNEEAGEYVWVANAGNGNVNTHAKSNSNFIRCVLQFENNENGAGTACGAEYKYSCDGENMIGGNGSICGGMYASCNCTNGYVWKNSTCIVCDETCSVGNILYSDYSCNSCLVRGKIPIGVVSYVNGSKRLAINLVHTEKEWGGYNMNISGLPNFDSITVKNDFSGKRNTSKIVSALGDTSDYAAGYCYNFTTSGTSKGDWYLPAAGELYASIVTNYSVVNNGINAAEGKDLTAGVWYYSSSQYNRFHTPFVGACSIISGVSKKTYVSTRCVLDF